MYYVAIPAEVFTEYISENVGSVMDNYISYCTGINRKMKPFEDARPVVSCTHNDAMSKNAVE